ncbi:phosphatidylcholine-hydrolyzing phospholipase c [Fusarium phyllophilum]|uniref:Phosphatidylcholine-hydrolyzing phospholipase c n=1 Tax=Fusarium phyllophilum TaxID=47803 RepID=A0A8H5K591_9HYPO|nr:phosphatidylcholine-hydrolyzing phospholipase c [Fusarium phyllophilum]
MPLRSPAAKVIIFQLRKYWLASEELRLPLKESYRRRSWHLKPPCHRKTTEVRLQSLIPLPCKACRGHELDMLFTGSDFDYKVKDSKLTFGDIIALTGDFYYRWHLDRCHPSISEDWDSNPSRSLDIAAENVNLLQNDKPGILKCVAPLIRAQAAQTKDAQSRGQDIAQAYRKVEKHFNTAFANCTYGYISIALCNPDHFGNDAKKAYSSVHTLALRKAIEANKSQSPSDLKEAYFIEGFAQHYLTDMFAAGHIRTPRHLLHSKKPFGETDNDDSVPGVFYGDQCCKAQHDEDCANGLWVTNQEGISWAAYGDKQLGQGRSGKNLQMAVSASQAGLDEVWETFQSGRMTESRDFRAIKKTPLPEKASGIRNSVPLFEIHPADPNYMLFRQNVDQRSISETRRKIKISEPNWKSLFNEINVSGATKNMYVYSKSFVSDQRFLHLGNIERATGEAVAGIYGPVDAGKFGRYWGMSAQGSVTFQTSTKKRTWTSADSLGNGIISLVARQYVNGTHTNALHVGYRLLENPNGQISSQVLWNQTVNDGNSGRAPGDVIYGAFAQGTDKRVMIKYFRRFDDPKSESKIEFWVLPAEAGRSPSQLPSSLKTKKINFLLSHKIEPTDLFSTFVGYQSGSSGLNGGMWYFGSWTSDYQEMRLTTISEPVSIPAQALLSDPTTGSLVRAFYGKRYATPRTIRLDVLEPRRNVTNGRIVFQDQPSSQEFLITWQAFNEEDYLLWFMHDVNGNGHADLVGYASDESNIFLTVVVFPRRGDGKFDAPIVSKIELDIQMGSLFTAEFMKPLYTAQTTYTYPTSGMTSFGAIMSFFDNYGIIAARIVAPEASRGTYKYELKGQDSAMAGQRSLTLDERPKQWMGLRKKSQSIGIIPM